MTSYEIFDLVCAEVSQKFKPKNRIFTYKYIVRKQRIMIHILNLTIGDINPIEVLDFLNKLQQNYGYDSHLGRFYFSCFCDQNITIFEILVQNEEEIRMFQHFYDLAIS